MAGTVLLGSLFPGPQNCSAAECLRGNVSQWLMLPAQYRKWRSKVSGVQFPSKSPAARQADDRAQEGETRAEGQEVPPVQPEGGQEGRRVGTETAQICS